MLASGPMARLLSTSAPGRAASAALGALLILSTAATVFAQDPPEGAQAKPAKDPYVGEDGVRRDPDGVKGISPYWEAINKGDKAFAAREFPNAIAAYKDAIQKEPGYAMAYYRLGEAHVATGELKEAEADYNAALRYAGQEHTLKAKILFCLADLEERKKDYDGAVKKWSEYEEFARSQPEAKAYPATAVDRKEKIAAYQKLAEQYAAVKERIAKRLAEANDASRRNRE